MRNFFNIFNKNTCTNNNTCGKIVIHNLYQIKDYCNLYGIRGGRIQYKHPAKRMRAILYPTQNLPLKTIKTIKTIKIINKQGLTRSSLLMEVSYL